MVSGVRGRVWLLVLAVLGGLGGDEHVCHGARYVGFQGCKFSSSICQPYEECVNDRLFGNCQPKDGEADRYQYYLDSSTLQALEAEIFRLIKEGYSWENLYTQCVIGNILVAFRKNADYNPRWCDQVGNDIVEKPQKRLDEESLKQLENYLANYYDFSNPDSSSELGTVDFDASSLEVPSSLEKKAEEYLKIHKYVPPTVKRADSISSPNDYDYGDSSDEESQIADLEKVLSGFSTSDLETLKDYLSQQDSNQFSSDFLNSADVNLSPDSRGYIWDDQPTSSEGSFSSSQAFPKNNKALDNEEVPLSDILSVEEDILNSNEDKPLPMTPEDAKLLGDLLQDKVQVSNLSNNQIQRIGKHVEWMLKGMGETKEDSKEEKQPDGMLNSADKLDVKESDMKGNDEKKAITKEQLNAVLLRNSNAKHNTKVTVKKTSMTKKNKPALGGQNAEEEIDGDDTDQTSPADTLSDVTSTTWVDLNVVNVELPDDIRNQEDAEKLATRLEKGLKLPPSTFSNIQFGDHRVSFEVNGNSGWNASTILDKINAAKDGLSNDLDLHIISAGIGRDAGINTVIQNDPRTRKFFVLTFVLCGCIAGVVLAVITVYVIKRNSRSREKLEQLAGSGDNTQVTLDYQDLCRQRMQSKASEKPEPLSAASRIGSTSESAGRSPSSRSSTSSWSEEPANSNMDISTGHIVLSYMEDHIKNKDRLDREWESLCAYEAEPSCTKLATDSSNMRKNRYSDVVPYDHSRVVLSTTSNVSSSDYINASSITDHDPRNPAYIATQGPLPHTVADFWQMVWEQGSVVIVNLTKMTENGVAMCHNYWPEEGSELYHIYEVHLVSEHIWCDDYLVRSFYLKNLQTNETRTVTQFHYLTWPDLGVPTSIKALLDFRRKVNKSYRGRSCPIVVHCSDGVGRTGTYCLIDMVLNRMTKGAKEIDIAASLEHLRDQRMSVVKTKEQFEFALAAVAEEVHAILKALPQQ